MKNMVKYLITDLNNCNGITFYDTKEEVIIRCGYDVDEITFEELLIEVEGEYEIVEIKGQFSMYWLVDDNKKIWD